MMYEFSLFPRITDNPFLLCYANCSNSTFVYYSALNYKEKDCFFYLSMLILVFLFGVVCERRKSAHVFFVRGVMDPEPLAGH